MIAKDVLNLAAKNHKRIEKEKQARQELEVKKQKEERQNKVTEKYKELKSKIERGIGYAANNGKFSYDMVLSETTNSLEIFATVNPITYNVAAKLKSYFTKKGFKVYFGGDTFLVDTSAAYLNSGGECGSSEPYYESVIVFRVSWGDNK